MATDQVGATSAAHRPNHDHDHGKKRSPLKWLLPLLLLLAVLAIAAFFLLGGDVDSDTEGEVELPDTDIDVDAPDIDAEAPDVDVDGGSVDVEDGDAEADAGN